MSKFKTAAPTVKKIAAQAVKRDAGIAKMNKAGDEIAKLGPGDRGKREAQGWNMAMGNAAKQGAEKEIASLKKQLPKAPSKGQTLAATRAPQPVKLSPQPAPQRLVAPKPGASASTLSAAPKVGAKPSGPLSAPSVGGAKPALKPQPAPQRLPKPAPSLAAAPKVGAKPAGPLSAPSVGGAKPAFKPGVIGNPMRASAPKIGKKG